MRRRKENIKLFEQSRQGGKRLARVELALEPEPVPKHDRSPGEKKHGQQSFHKLRLMS